MGKVTELLHYENKGLSQFLEVFEVPTHLSSVFKLTSKLCPCEETEDILQLIATTSVKPLTKGYDINKVPRY